MTLARFIRENSGEILSEWTAFAETLEPAAKGLSREQLQDYAREMLLAIADDMEQPQSEQEQDDKSKGEPREQDSDVVDSARVHASERLAEGFTLDQLMVEYRALRASVIRRWTSSLGSAGVGELDELTRFNEAVDQLLTYSVAWYSNRLDQARDLFVGALGHDLRTPLGAIMSSVEVQLGQAEASSSIFMTNALRIRNSTIRIEKMVSALLDFTRTRFEGGLPLTIEAGNVLDTLRAVVDEAEAQYPTRSIRIEHSGDLGGEWDLGRIEELFQNLIENAVRHGESGGTVTVRAWAQNDQVHVAIHNFGRPIPPEVQRLIFDPLTRGTVGAGDKKFGTGLGLGLFIAREIVKAHGGSIQVASSAAEGTTFTVSLPRRPGVEEA